jgi:FKBP-type peptidyl-prolyl cis-trans isomerase
MSNPFQRAGAMALALLFLATTIAFTGLIVYQISRNDDEVSPINTNQQQDTNNTNDEEAPVSQLQGTKLQGFTPVTSVSELQIIDLEEGTGAVVQPGATVTAHYTGALASDGTIFQSSHDFGQPIPFSLSGVIKGWTDGVPGMKVGGKRRLIIPAAQAYGPQSQPGIPANSDLVFDIELVAVQ